MAAALALTTSTIAAGGEIHVTGTEFKKGESVSIYVHGEHIKEFATDGAGGFNGHVPVPASLASGGVEVTALGALESDAQTLTIS